MKLNWIESTYIFHDTPVYSLVDENNFELIWFYCEENIKKWVVTLNVPKKETVYYNIENAKDIKDVKFRAILELQYKLEEIAKKYFNYCDLIGEMVIEHLKGLNDANK
jgi:hypothetical protein